MRLAEVCRRDWWNELSTALPDDSLRSVDHKRSRAFTASEFLETMKKRPLFIKPAARALSHATGALILHWFVMDHPVGVAGLVPPRIHLIT